MYRFFTKTALLWLFVLGVTSMATAQNRVAGQVTDGEETLIGVTVLVKGTTIGTFTDDDGNFELNVPSLPATLIFSYTGFTEFEQEISSVSRNMVITLEESSSFLDEVVVTGLATTVKRSNLANAVATIDEAQLTGVTTQQTMDGALYGKFTGAEIRANSGAPGGGIGIRLRGVTSIFGNQQPLFIVDGIFVDNSTVSLGTNIVSAAAGGGNTSTNQDDASNRIADIDPEDIESIEILKGASAAAIYGSRAAGGVVIITTKRGEPGKTTVKFSQAIGMIEATQLLGGRDWDAAKVEEVFSESDADLFNQNGTFDYENELFGGTGLLSTTRLSVSGGSDKTSFFIGGTYKDDEGIVENTGYEKASVRVNLTHKINKWLDIDFTNNFINSTADRGFFNNGNTNTTVGYALAFTRPWVDLFPDDAGNYPANPSVGSNVLETVALATNRERVNRYIGGLTGTVQLFSNDKNSLLLRLRGGLDQYTLRTTAIFPQQLSFFRDPSTLSGVSVSGSTVNTVSNLNAFLVHTMYTESDMTFRTQLGVTQEDFNQNTIITTATGLNGSQTNVDQAATSAAYQNRIIQQDKGIFLQEEVNWKDRIIGTVGVRADKSSNNGDPNKLYYYPKANIAFNVHNFDFFDPSLFSQVKIRAAYGEAGRFANFDDRFNALEGTLIEGLSGLQTLDLRGNTEVGPERQSELEFGADLTLLDNKISFGATYYIKKIDDLLLRQQVATSSGYTRKVVNAGALKNNGIELDLTLNPVSTKNFQWGSYIRWWTNTSEITRLDIPAFNLGGFAASLGQYRIEEGKSATQIIGTYNPDDCDGCDPDGDGFAVYGDAEPDFNLSFANYFTIAKNIQFSFNLHWKEGGDAVNLSTLLYDLANLTWDYDDTNLDPTGQMVNGDYRKAQRSGGSAGPWIEDAGYIRLREVGLFYTIPRENLNDVTKLRFGVSAYNLINIFDYNSYDPEVSNFGGNVLANAIEVTPFPASRRYYFHLSATF